MVEKTWRYNLNRIKTALGKTAREELKGRTIHVEKIDVERTDEKHPFRKRFGVKHTRGIMSVREGGRKTKGGK